MKHLFLNLKRFDIPSEYGGVNRLSPVSVWGSYIVESTQEKLKEYAADEAEFVQFFPEAHILAAASAKSQGSPVQIGCQSVHHDDVAQGGNFGAFTTGRTAKAAVSLGCTWTIIGHCEERRDIMYIMEQGGQGSRSAVSRILNKKIKAAQCAGLSVLYCVGELAEEQPQKYEVLKDQLMSGLQGVDLTKVIIAYEPVWAIGPGKTPPDAGYIRDIAMYIKSIVDVPVVYGGGLKEDNAMMLSSIKEVDGGLIALTRFSGEIGFYPDEYLKIINIYLGGIK